MASVADIQALGYTVAATAGGYRIAGFGVTSYFTDDDLTKFAAGHAERVKQFVEGPPALPPPPVSPLAPVIAALETLDQSKPAAIGDVVAALRKIG